MVSRLAARLAAMKTKGVLKPSPKGKKAKAKIGKVMHEFKAGMLHSGSKHGPMVKSKRQALAIALSEARRRAS